MSSPPLAKVLVAIDFSDASTAALTEGRRLAAEGAALILMHVLPITPIDVDAEAAARTRAAGDQLGILRSDQLPHESPHVFNGPFTADTLDRFSPGGRAVAEELQRWVARVPGNGQTRAVLRVGDPSAEIVAAAQQQDADLMILGVHDSGPAPEHNVGGVADRVIRAAPCPVLVVHARRAVLDRRAMVRRIHAGMAVYDRVDEKIGTVRDVYLGSEPGAVTTREPCPPHSLVDDLVHVLAPPAIPDVMRERLLREGFIRIDTRGPFAADRFAFASQIRDVSEVGVRLDAGLEELLRR